jgi:hypothetical protein
MPKVNKVTVDRIQKFLAAWRELAPGATFAGMTLAEFEVAVSAPLNLRADIVALETQLDGKKAEKLDADLAADVVLDLVVNSVRGTPGFGQDCAVSGLRIRPEERAEKRPDPQGYQYHRECERCVI